MSWRGRRLWALVLGAYALLLTLCTLADMDPLTDAGQLDVARILVLLMFLGLRGLVLFIAPPVLVYRWLRGDRRPASDRQ